MAHPLSRRPAPRGSTLLEALIALSILLVGLLGMAQLQLLSLGANQGARARAQALEIAKELASGLERLEYDDTLLAPTVTAPSADFGRALRPDGSIDGSSFRAWSDSYSALVPNVRLDTTFEGDVVDTSLPGFQRRWAVWAPAGLAAQYSKLIAVSVTYHEKSLSRPMEVTLLTQVSNAGAAIANAAAYR